MLETKLGARLQVANVLQAVAAWRADAARRLVDLAVAIELARRRVVRRRRRLHSRVWNGTPGTGRLTLQTTERSGREATDAETHRERERATIEEREREREGGRGA